MSQNFLIKRLNSFKYAFSGMRSGLKNQPNLIIHFIAAVVAVGLGLYLHISSLEWCAIIICIASVISLELINTAIEILCDFVHKEQHEKIKNIKDISAAAVLISAIGALVVGLIIFIPKFIILVK